MNLLGIIHYFFRKKISKPNGINLLGKLTTRDKNRWHKNVRYYFTKECVEYSPKGVILKTRPDKTVYFNRDTWKWSYEPQDGYNEVFDQASGRCDTMDKQTIDVYNPGKIITKSDVPQKGGVLGIWIYFEEHPHDKHKPNRDVYFELDIIETEPAIKTNPYGIIFTHWLGKYQSDAIHGGKWLKRKFKSTDRIVSELSWDGDGNFKWKVDGITVKTVSLNLPKYMKPYVIFSMASKMNKDVISSGLIEWSVYQK